MIPVLNTLRPVPLSVFSLSGIKENETILQEYITNLQSKCPSKFENIKQYAHEMCPELKDFYDIHVEQYFAKNSKEKDKGRTGKYAEFALFGNLPNSKSCSDLLNGYDIKATHFKKLSNMGQCYTAKERLTITNCGNKNNYGTFHNIIDTTTLQDCKYYEKMQKGIVIIYNYEKENIDDETILSIFKYNLNELPDCETEILNKDFAAIQKCVIDQTVSQKGQIYLHIHKHGTKLNPNTCALGFTNKFLTKITSVFANKNLTVKGRSWGIEF